MKWAQRRPWLAASCALALSATVAGFALSAPWKLDDPSFRAGILQTFVTLAALFLAVPAAWAAWEAYRIETERVGVRLFLGATAGPEFADPIRVMFVKQGEAQARGFLVEISFNCLVDDVQKVWPPASPAVSIYPDAPPNIAGVTYVFTEPFGSSGPEILADISIDSMRWNPAVFKISWNVRGGNVLPADGTLAWPPRVVAPGGSTLSWLS